MGVGAVLSAAIVLASFGGGGVRAQETTEPPAGQRPALAWPTIGGSLRGAFWSDSRDFDGRENLPVAMLWLHGRSDPHAAVSMYVDGRIGNDDLVRAEATQGKLREAYLDVRAGALDVRLGRQIIAWGRADQINPTDTLTPRDFTLLVPEDGDQRSGATGVRATYRVGRFGDLGLTGVLLPTFEPHTIRLQRPPQGSTLRERVPGDPVLQGALKLEQTGRGFDYSVSYFDGYDLFPDLGIDTVRPDGVDLLLRHHRIRVVGADAAAALGAYTLRGEAAYTFTEHERAGDQIKSPFLFLVLGADRSLPRGWYVNVQYVLRLVSQYRDPQAVAGPTRPVAVEQALINDQLDEVKHAVAVRIASTWLSETLRAEVSAIVSPERHEFVVRPKASYAVTDRLKVAAGADFFRGDTPSFFGRLRETSTAYVEVRWDF